MAEVVKRPVTDFDEFTGRFVAVERVEVRPRVSGYIIGAMPAAMAVMMYFTSPRSFDLLITEPLGHAVLGGSAVMVAIGLFLNHRIASVEM